MRGEAKEKRTPQPFGMAAESPCLPVSKSPCLSFRGWPKIVVDRRILFAILTIMHATSETAPRPNKLQQAEAAFAQLIVEASRRGFYGTAGLTLSIQDGTIQHVRVALERMIK
jgi:hypothetical protein